MDPRGLPGRAPSASGKLFPQGLLSTTEVQVLNVIAPFRVSGAERKKSPLSIRYLVHSKTLHYADSIFAYAYSVHYILWEAKYI